ncbi:PulJ/GspJ family protein [Oceanirhabdus seepicola]|uniref:Prepilin-type N-terminal cleavage/methylation domain-containing protein n=1 Tax=Oceanirhabdus seepicola TaxID=2828781 RepID=A0A9J6P3V0_9CLOT|nr:prepilin-type N-terminal cleavage/methylation domain-containing protein [Oceanirhabdus seepicola]MCM1990846.1 prepilin-type N-terminal cleavage/methylation domain-containing protein [Oceanirhabdus seepicola]
MMKNKKGFTLMEVMLVMAIFSMASVVIFSVFMSNYMRIEAQGRETYLQEDIDRGLTRLSNRLMGTCEIVENRDIGVSDTVLLSFNYYYKDNKEPYEGDLYLVENDGLYTLKLHSKREVESKVEELTNTFMSYVKNFNINFINESGGTTSPAQACALEINYTVTTSYKKIVKEKTGKVIIKLRNINPNQEEIGG